MYLPKTFIFSNYQFDANVQGFQIPRTPQSILSAGVLSAIYFGSKALLETRWARSRLIMNKATSDIKLMAENFPFLMKEQLAEDLTKAQE